MRYTKLKFNHKTDKVAQAFGVDEKRRETLNKQVSSALARGFMDPKVNTISQAMEIALEECKTVEEVAYSAFLFGRGKAELGAKIKMVEEIIKKHEEPEVDSKAQDELLAKASAMSVRAQKYIN